MRQRAALILILIAAVWAAGVFASPAQAQQGPPPHAEGPKEKKPKPEKPDGPQGPKDPAPEEPPALPEPTEPPAEPPPPEVEEPPVDTDDGAAGPGGGTTGGGTTGGGSGAEPRASGPGSARGPLSPGAVLGATAGDGRSAGSRPGEGVPRTLGSAPSPGFGEDGDGVGATYGSPSALESGRTAGASAESIPAAAPDDGVAGVGVLPLTVLVGGLALVSVGLAVGLARVHAGRSWHPPGSRPERT